MQQPQARADEVQLTAAQLQALLNEVARLRADAATRDDDAEEREDEFQDKLDEKRIGWLSNSVKPLRRIIDWYTAHTHFGVRMGIGAAWTLLFGLLGGLVFPPLLIVAVLGIPLAFPEITAEFFAFVAASSVLAGILGAAGAAFPGVGGALLGATIAGVAVPAAPYILTAALALAAVVGAVALIAGVVMGCRWGYQKIQTYRAQARLGRIAMGEAESGPSEQAPLLTAAQRGDKRRRRKRRDAVESDANTNTSTNTSTNTGDGIDTDAAAAASAHGSYANAGARLSSAVGGGAAAPPAQTASTASAGTREAASAAATAAAIAATAAMDDDSWYYDYEYQTPPADSAPPPQQPTAGAAEFEPVLAGHPSAGTNAGGWQQPVAAQAAPPPRF